MKIGNRLTLPKESPRQAEVATKNWSNFPSPDAEWMFMKQKTRQKRLKETVSEKKKNETCPKNMLARKQTQINMSGERRKSINRKKGRERRER